MLIMTIDDDDADDDNDNDNDDDDDDDDDISKKYFLLKKCSLSRRKNFIEVFRGLT